MSEKQEKQVESELIWKEIKDLPIAMFSLPSQTVKQYVLPLPLPGKELLVRLTSTAVLPSLEAALSMVSGKKYEVEVAEDYVIVRRAHTRSEDIKKVLAPFIVAK